GYACFVCETDHDVGEIGCLETCECPWCSLSVALDLTMGQHMLEHMGAHILFDAGTINSKGVLCGLCLHPPSICRYFLMKGKGAHGSTRINQQASHGCLMKMKFSYGIAAESSQSSPCSNVPIQCPICPKTDLAVWKYFMKHHFEEKHKSLKLTEYSQYWNILAFECDKMRKIWLKQTNGTAKPARTLSKPTLKISEVHRAQISLRCVELAALI
ncbi:hypothetical protein BDQ17DRAFT_1242113, partial [Cyathus striatus]